MAINKSKSKKIVTKVEDVSVTQYELQAVKRTINSQGLSLRHDIKSVRHDITSVRHDIKSLSEKMDSQFHKTHEDLHKILAIVEEQNARNKAVMDSQSLVQYKLDEFDQRLSKVESSR